jgi:hypothetical protein
MAADRCHGRVVATVIGRIVSDRRRCGVGRDLCHHGSFDIDRLVTGMQFHTSSGVCTIFDDANISGGGSGSGGGGLINNEPVCGAHHIAMHHTLSKHHG